MTEIIPIDSIKMTTSRLKDMDEEHQFKLMMSLKLHGQLRNILVTENLEIIEGRRIFLMMKKLGFNEVECKICDENQADKLMQMQLCLDCEFSEFNFVQISVALSKTHNLENKKDLYGILPFQNNDIDDYIESIAWSMDKYNNSGSKEQTTLFNI